MNATLADGGAAHAATAPGPAEMRKAFGFRFVAPLALGATLNPVNSTMIAMALVPIAADYNVPIADTGWLLAGLYLTSAIAQPTLGRLADMLGPRKIYLASLLLVAAAAMMGRFAPSLTSLTIARGLLGIGTSGAYPSAMRIFRMRAERLGAAPPRLAMSFMALASLTTAAIGPWLGGTLTSNFGWHSIFVVNVPITIVTATLVLLWTPADQPRPAGPIRLLEQLDLLGILLFAIGLSGVMIFLLNPAHPSWIALGTGLAVSVVFLVHSARTPQPFIDVRMLARNRALAMTLLRAGSLMMICYAMIFGFAQWLESGRGLPGSEAGLAMLPMSIVGAVSSLAGARIKSIRTAFLVAILSAAVGCGILTFVTSATPVWLIAIAAMCFGLPQGLFTTATQAAIYTQAPASEIGTAAGLQRTAQYLGAIAATSLMGLLFGRHATDHSFHQVALLMGLLSSAMLVMTFFDRTLRRPIAP